MLAADEKPTKPFVRARPDLVEAARLRRESGAYGRVLRASTLVVAVVAPALAVAALVLACLLIAALWRDLRGGALEAPHQLAA